MLAARFRRLEQRSEGTFTVLVADSFASRLLGLAFLAEDDAPPTCALLLPRCSSVHTFGMRFCLDITFLDAGGLPLHIARNVKPRRVVRHRHASAVLERRSPRTRARADRQAT